MTTPPTPGDLGDILKFLEIVAVIGTGLVVVFKVGRAVERFELIGQTQAREISELKDTIKAVAAAQSASISDRALIATQGMQIAEMRQEINLMRQGRGFIRQDTDGQWPK
jgi:hypothetical protein